MVTETAVIWVQLTASNEYEPVKEFPALTSFTYVGQAWEFAAYELEAFPPVVKRYC